MTIRPATDADWLPVWAMFRAVVATGDAFAYDSETTEVTARKLWFESPSVAYVAEESAQIVGTYFLRPNQPGRGSHVANGGYMVAESARGRGIASAMCLHSLQTARELGYLAMQFNCVVSSNEAAVKSWQKQGFAIVGTLPGAFLHDTLGYVDVYVMYRLL